MSSRGTEHGRPMSLAFRFDACATSFANSEIKVSLFRRQIALNWTRHRSGPYTRCNGPGSVGLKRLSRSTLRLSIGSLRLDGRGRSGLCDIAHRQNRMKSRSPRRRERVGAHQQHEDERSEPHVLTSKGTSIDREYEKLNYPLLTLIKAFFNARGRHRATAGSARHRAQRHICPSFWVSFASSAAKKSACA